MEEVWKPIKGYEGLYEVSNYGRIRSLDRYVNSASSKTGVSETQIRRLINNKKPSRDGYTFSIIKPSVEDNERVNND